MWLNSGMWMKETGKAGRKRKSCAQIGREKKGELFIILKIWSLAEKAENYLLIVF